MIDNIEIGTADFNTLIESAEGTGISVEPVPAYFRRLPDRDEWRKVNKAIMDYNGSVMCHYVDPVKAEGLPQWVRGCNAMGAPHPTIQRMFPGIVKTEKVECITIEQFYEQYDIGQVGFMKIDTEGMDRVIVKQMMDKDLPLPEKIQFEWNILSDDDKMKKLVKRLKKRYKTVKKGRYNIVCY